MGAVMEQLLSRNQVSLALDEWTSMNKLATASAIAYDMDRKWALREVQHTCDVIPRLCISIFES